jgi:hypothetical protein
MKIKNALSMIAAVLAIASAGETKAGPETGQGGLGTIIVYRPWSIIGGNIRNWEFNLDDGPDLFVRNGSYYRLSVLPGDYTISHGDLLVIDEDPQMVHVEAGQTVYFEYTAILSLIFEVADDQEKAARTVSRLEPLN